MECRRRNWDGFFRRLPAPPPFFLYCRNRGSAVFSSGVLWCYKTMLLFSYCLCLKAFLICPLLRGMGQAIAESGSPYRPSVFHPRVLGVGLLVGEWSEIGMDPRIDAGTLEAAWNMALGALQTLATERESDIVAFYNFNQHGKLPGEVFNQFNRVQCPPCALLRITFNSLEEYISRFSRAARKDLNRKMRASREVRVIRSRDISPFLDRIYKLYLETVERGPMAFGSHNRLFFEKYVKESRAPSTRSILCRKNWPLLTFSSCDRKRWWINISAWITSSAANTTCMSCPGLKTSAAAWSKTSLSITRGRGRRNQGASRRNVYPEPDFIQSPPAGDSAFPCQAAGDDREDPPIPRVLARGPVEAKGDP